MELLVQKVKVQLQMNQVLMNQEVQVQGLILQPLERVQAQERVQDQVEQVPALDLAILEQEVARDQALVVALVQAIQAQDLVVQVQDQVQVVRDQQQGVIKKYNAK